jgi:hypothetical protein
VWRPTYHLNTKGKKTYSILPLAKNQTTKVSHLRAQSKERNSSCMRTAHLGDVGLGGNALLPGLRGEQGRDAFPRVALRCHCHAAFSYPPAPHCKVAACSLVAALARRPAVAPVRSLLTASVRTTSVGGTSPPRPSARPVPAESPCSSSVRAPVADRDPCSSSVRATCSFSPPALLYFYLIKHVAQGHVREKNSPCDSTMDMHANKYK